MMTEWMCTTCGTQYPPSEQPPQQCPICEDDRQYVLASGQHWTTLESLQEQGHANIIRWHEPGLLGIKTEPEVGLGQRALLVRTPHGNVLWDCISYLDEENAHLIDELGGISFIAISHPHFFSSMGVWAERFQAKILLHADHQPFVMKPNEHIHYWEGERFEVFDGVTLLRLGGHFPGSTVLHWRDGAAGKGTLLTGDTIYRVTNQRMVSFMYSYPNSIPLSAKRVAHIRDTVKPYAFDRLYASFEGRVLTQDAWDIVQQSADRYIQHLSE